MIGNILHVGLGLAIVLLATALLFGCNHIADGVLRLYEWYCIRRHQREVGRHLANLRTHREAQRILDQARETYDNSEAWRRDILQPEGRS